MSECTLSAYPGNIYTRRSVSSEENHESRHFSAWKITSRLHFPSLHSSPIVKFPINRGTKGCSLTPSRRYYVAGTSGCKYLPTPNETVQSWIINTMFGNYLLEFVYVPLERSSRCPRREVDESRGWKRYGSSDSRSAACWTSAWRSHRAHPRIGTRSWKIRSGLHFQDLIESTWPVGRAKESHSRSIPHEEITLGASNDRWFVNRRPGKAISMSDHQGDWLVSPHHFN